MPKSREPKNRIIFVPQYPTSLRYSEWWVTQFPQEFRNRGFEVITLGNDFLFKHNMKKSMLAFNNSKDLYSFKEALINLGKPNYEQFAPVDLSIEFEIEQIKEFMKLEVTDCDLLFHADLSFPGLFHHVLFHKKPAHCFCFCHATSRNYLDYFSKDVHIKFPIEKKVAELYDTVFVGSDYHASKILFDNMTVTYLPPPPFPLVQNAKKKNDIISVARQTPQKFNQQLERKVEKKFSKIKRFDSKTWAEYYKNIAESKIMLISASEETFGYQVVDAVINDCIPLAPRNYSYPELLPDKYLYRDEKELMTKITYFLKTYKKEMPILLCQEQMNGFYNKITKVMKNALQNL